MFLESSNVQEIPSVEKSNFWDASHPWLIPTSHPKYGKNIYHYKIKQTRLNESRRTREPQTYQSSKVKSIAYNRKPTNIRKVNSLNSIPLLNKEVTSSHVVKKQGAMPSWYSLYAFTPPAIYRYKNHAQQLPERNLFAIEETRRWGPMPEQWIFELKPGFIIGESVSGLKLIPRFSDHQGFIPWSSKPHYQNRSYLLDKSGPKIIYKSSIIYPQNSTTPKVDDNEYETLTGNGDSSCLTSKLFKECPIGKMKCPTKSAMMECPTKGVKHVRPIIDTKTACLTKGEQMVCPTKGTEVVNPSKRNITYQRKMAKVGAKSHFKNVDMCQMIDELTKEEINILRTPKVKPVPTEEYKTTTNDAYSELSELKGTVRPKEENETKPAHILNDLIEIVNNPEGTTKQEALENTSASTEGNPAMKVEMLWPLQTLDETESAKNEIFSSEVERTKKLLKDVKEIRIIFDSLNEILQKMD